MTVVSTAMRDEARRIELRPPKLDVLPMGVDLQRRFVIDPNVQRAGNELLFVGRLVGKKGLKHLLNAMPKVLAQRPETILTIVGFGPEEAALRMQACQLGIESSVNFIGATPQRELPALYRRASVFVAPFVRDASGDQEGLPVVLMEAIGCGCPVIVGDVAGVHDLLGSAANEVCANPLDAVMLSAFILQALESPELAHKRALNIRQAVSGRIDWQVIADGYADFLGNHSIDSAVSD